MILNMATNGSFQWFVILFFIVTYVHFVEKTVMLLQCDDVDNHCQ